VGGGRIRTVGVGGGMRLPGVELGTKSTLEVGSKKSAVKEKMPEKYLRGKKRD